MESVYLPMHWVLSAMLSASGCAKAVISILVALLLVLNIVLEISGEILYIAFHVHIILVITQKYWTMLSATHSHKPHKYFSLGFLPIISLALKWQGLQDLHIFIFAFLNMKTIFCTLLAFLGHQKHKKCWFQASYATVNYILYHSHIPVHTIYL